MSSYLNNFNNIGNFLKVTNEFIVLMKTKTAIQHLIYCVGKVSKLFIIENTYCKIN